jgi:hypothetical protein
VRNYDLWELFGEKPKTTGCATALPRRSASWHRATCRLLFIAMVPEPSPHRLASHVAKACAIFTTSSPDYAHQASRTRLNTTARREVLITPTGSSAAA